MKVGRKMVIGLDFRGYSSLALATRPARLLHGRGWTHMKAARVKRNMVRSVVTGRVLFVWRGP